VRPIVASTPLAACLAALVNNPQQPESSATLAKGAYLGFDHNDYPGDENLPALRKKYAFAGYWLNKPLGAANNTWIGKRKLVQAAGFGFLVAFNGRTFAEIKSIGDPSKLGRSDGGTAVEAAKHEGFPPGTIIFLDQEEGGRLLPAQRGYLHAWINAVKAASFEAGVYCSGIPAREALGASVVTAIDIQQSGGGRKLGYWVSNDQCPPSPGCAFPPNPPMPAASGVALAQVWQFAQSPRRSKFASDCKATYNKDGNCYPPGSYPQQLHVDLDSSTSADPSRGRTRD